MKFVNSMIAGGKTAGKSVVFMQMAAAVFCLLSFSASTGHAVDVTPQLQSLGSPVIAGNSTFAMNIWDMQVFSNRIYFGAGEAAYNQGSSPTFYIDPVNNQIVTNHVSGTYQIAVFRIIDGKLCFPLLDKLPRTERFMRLDGTNWVTYSGVDSFTHHYDIYGFAGKIFEDSYSLSICDTNGNNWVNYAGVNVGRGVSSLFDFQGVFYNPGCDFTSPYQTLVASEYHGTGFNTRPDLNFQAKFPGITNALTGRIFRPAVFDNQLIYIGSEIWVDFENYPFGLFVASSLERGNIQTRRVALPSTNSMPWDILVRPGRAYVLLSEKIEGSPDSFINKVLLTTDCNTWTELFRFTQPTFARSFEELNGDFYFGLGTDIGPSLGRLPQFNYNPSLFTYTDTQLTQAGTILLVSRSAYLTTNAISYSCTNFLEATANNGSIDNSTPVQIRLVGDTFSGNAGEDLAAAGKVLVSNLPSGLTAVVSRVSSGLAEISLTGRAVAHAPTNSIANLTLTFQDSAFAGGLASAIAGATRSDLLVTYPDYANCVLGTSPVAGGKTVPASGTNGVIAGRKFAVTAAPASSNMFDHWVVSGGAYVQDVGAETTVAVLASNGTITAIFTNGANLSIVAGDGTDNSGGTVAAPLPSASHGSFTRCVPTNTPVTIVAAADPGYCFTGWTIVANAGNVTISDASAPITAVTLRGNASIRANFAGIPPYKVDIVNGLNSSYCTNKQVLPVHADPPAAGKVFDKWTGTLAALSCADVNSMYTTYSVSSPATLTASYVDAPVSPFTLTVNSGTGGGSYTAGTSVTVSAAAPAAGQVFDKWTGAGVSNVMMNAFIPSTTVVMPDSNVTLTATYRATNATAYALSVSSGSGSGSYTLGTVIPVVASAPAVGKAFDRWTGSTAYVEDIYSSSTVFVMPAAAAGLTATYRDNQPVMVNVTFSVNPPGAGAASSSSQVPLGTSQVPTNVTLALNASRSTGYTFSSWSISGGGRLSSPTAQSTLLIVTNDTTVVANLTPVSVLTMSASPAAGGATYPVSTNTFAQATAINISAIPADGYMFNRWSVSGSATVADTASPYTTVTLSGDGTASAIFDSLLVPPVITSPLAVTGMMSAPFAYTISGSSGPTNYDAPGLPSGLLVNHSSGLISGTPAASGTTDVIISAANAYGIGTATLTVVVVPYSNTPPAIVTPVTATPNPVTGTSALLTVLGSDEMGESGLRYSWSSSGGGAVSFSANGSNAAKNCTALFTNAGSYVITATIADPGNQIVTSSCTVTVSQTLSSIAVSPSTASVHVASSQTFTASGLDQFGHAMSMAAPAWSVSGGGTINTAGLFTASIAGSFTVTAASGGRNGTADISVSVAGVDPNLMGYWSFDEGSGTVAMDYSGRGNTGVIRGCTWKTGQAGTCLEFNGSTNDYVTLGNVPDLQITSNQTIAMWLKPVDFAVRRIPFGKSYGGEGAITLETDGSMKYFYGTAGADNMPYKSYTMTPKLSSNVWTHVAVVRDLSNMKIRFYRNGVPANTTTADYAYATASPMSAYIGKGYVSNMLGQIDEVRVYNRALSDSEVTALTSVAPVITSQPSSTTVFTGQSAAFTVAASGLPAPAFQWLRNGSIVSGATNTSYSITTVPGDNGALFSAVASNTGGLATSTVAALTVCDRPVSSNWVVQMQLATGNVANLTYNQYISLLQNDSDGDGMLNWQEYLAGSDPTNNMSTFVIAGMTAMTGSNLLTWSSVTNASLPPYTVERRTNLVGGNWVILDSQVARTAPVCTWWDTNPAVLSPNYYRISVTNNLGL